MENDWGMEVKVKSGKRIKEGTVCTHGVLLTLEKESTEHGGASWDVSFKVQYGANGE